MDVGYTFILYNHFPTAKFILFSSSAIQTVQLYLILRHTFVVKHSQCVCVNTMHSCVMTHIWHVSIISPV